MLRFATSEPILWNHIDCLSSTKRSLSQFIQWISMSSSSSWKVRLPWPLSGSFQRLNSSLWLWLAASFRRSKLRMIVKRHFNLWIWAVVLSQKLPFLFCRLNWERIRTSRAVTITCTWWLRLRISAQLSLRELLSTKARPCYSLSSKKYSASKICSTIWLHRPISNSKFPIGKYTEMKRQ